MKIKVNFEHPLKPGDVITKNPDSDDSVRYLVLDEEFIKPISFKKNVKVDTSDFDSGTVFYIESRMPLEYGERITQVNFPKEFLKTNTIK